jgi:hypothetical protein
MIAPAGEFYAIVAKALDLREQCFEWYIGPLAGEESNGS